MTITLYTIAADKGCPGNPKTILSLTFPIIVGLPGFIAMPWTKTPGSPKLFITSIVTSFFPTELPPDISTISVSSIAFSTVSFRRLKSSLIIP